MMLNDVEKRKLEVLINAANKGDQEALTNLQTLFGHVSEFEEMNKKERIVSIWLLSILYIIHHAV